MTRGPGTIGRSSVYAPSRSTCNKKNPHQLSPVRVHFHQIKSLAVTYFHIDKVDTSIGAERFHFRVRKGIGWFPLAMAARQTVCKVAESWLSPFTNPYTFFRFSSN